jgi:hypothetical protein
MTTCVFLQVCHLLNIFLDNMEEPKFDKTAFEVVNGFDNASDKEY